MTDLPYIRDTVKLFKESLIKTCLEKSADPDQAVEILEIVNNFVEDMVDNNINPTTIIFNLNYIYNSVEREHVQQKREGEKKE